MRRRRRATAASSSCRLSDAGPDFDSYFGASLSSIDNLADRSPAGELEITGGCLRFLHALQLEDVRREPQRHDASDGRARVLGGDGEGDVEGQPPTRPSRWRSSSSLPFVSDYKFFEDMGVRVFANGHSYSGVNFSHPQRLLGGAGYEDAMRAAYGAERTTRSSAVARHNTVYYPSLTIKGAIQSIRVVRPLAADRTVIESWTFRLKGAPDALLQRTVNYNRLIISPFSVVGHDDLHAYRRSRRGCTRAAIRGSACSVTSTRASRPREVTAHRNQRDLDAQPVPRLGRVHDCDDGARRGADAERRANAMLIAFVVREARLLDDKRYAEWPTSGPTTASTGCRSSRAARRRPPHLASLRGQAAAHAPCRAAEEPARLFAAAAEPRATTCCRRRRSRRATPRRSASSLRTPVPLHRSAGRRDRVVRRHGLPSSRPCEGGALRLRLKRVDLLNGDAALPAVQLFI